MCPRRKKESWQMLIVPKPLFIGRGQAIHKCGRKWWIVREHPCLTEDSKVKVYLFKQNQKPVMNGLFRKAMRFTLRLLGAAIVTYLFAFWIIEKAFLERGYAAYGGEYILIAFVFFVIYKLMNIGKEEK